MTSDPGAPGTPRFNVVLRGYDRRQVDEHVARLQRVIARMRADLSARAQYGDGPGQPQRGPGPQGWNGPPPGPGESADAINGFTDRMQRILQSAEDEAEEIRNKARIAARAEGEQVRAQLDDLVRQREGMLRELAQIRGQLHEAAPDRTTRLPRPATGDQPRGAIPSPRPRPSAPPSGPPPVPPPSDAGAGPRPEQPKRGSRFDWPATPPLWEISTAGPARPTDRPGWPPADPRAGAPSNPSPMNSGAPNAAPPKPGSVNPGSPHVGPSNAGSPGSRPSTSGAPMPNSAGSTPPPGDVAPSGAGSSKAGPSEPDSGVADPSRSAAPTAAAGGPARDGDVSDSERTQFQRVVPAAEKAPVDEPTSDSQQTDQRRAEPAGPGDGLSAAARLAASKRQGVLPFNGSKPDTGVLFRVPPASAGSGDPAAAPVDGDKTGADKIGAGNTGADRTGADGADATGPEHADVESTDVTKADRETIDAETVKADAAKSDAPETDAAADAPAETGAVKADAGKAGVQAVEEAPADGAPEPADSPGGRPRSGAEETVIVQAVRPNVVSRSGIKKSSSDGKFDDGDIDSSPTQRTRPASPSTSTSRSG